MNVITELNKTLGNLSNNTEIELRQMLDLRFKLEIEKRAREKRLEIEKTNPQAFSITDVEKAYINANSFPEFIREAFPHVEQGREFRYNWHFDIMGEVLQSTLTLEVKNFIINIPRRCSKSTILCVMFPAWVWTFMAFMRFIYTSYSQDFATRDNTKCGELVTSDWYKQKYGNYFLTTQNKYKLINSEGGFRQVFKLGKGTGSGGDYVLADDPNDIMEQESETVLKKTAVGWNEIAFHNVTDRNRAVRGLIQQRVGINDVTASIIDNPDLKPLYAHLCYDKETEILTEKGWLKFAELPQGVKVAQVDTTDLSISFDLPSRYVAYKYTGKIYHYKSACVDLMVTPDHRMFYKDGNDLKKNDFTGNWRVRPASELPQDFYLPQSAFTENEDTKVRLGDYSLDGDDFARFMGVWLAEGCVTNYRSGKVLKKSVVISQDDGDFATDIESLLNRFGFKFSKNYQGKKRPNHIHFVSHNKFLAEYLSQFGKSGDKYVPTVIKQMSKRQIEIFLDWFAKGDGHRTKRNPLQICYTSKSQQMIDDIQELMLRVGRTGGIQTHSNCYRIQERAHKQKNGSGYKYYGKVRKENTSEVDYDDFVYCVSVSTGAIVVRRNGKPAISGNCLPMEYDEEHPDTATPKKPLMLGRVNTFEYSNNPELVVGEEKLWVDPRDKGAPYFDNKWYQAWYKKFFLDVGLTSRGEGQLLWENYINAEIANVDKKHLGAYGTSSQYQQRPIMRGGNFFDTDDFGDPQPYTEDDIDDHILVRYWDKAGCFLKGTLIETIHGAKPIEQIVKGDLVLTRKGYKKVQWSGISGFTDEFVTATFSDGRKLHATPNHPVWTENRGWVELRHLCSYDNIVSLDSYLGEDKCQITKKEKAQNPMPTRKLEYLTELLIGADQTKDILKQCVGIKSTKDIIQNHYIKQFGSSITEKFHLNLISITRTKISTTMKSQTLSALQEASITENTLINGKRPNTKNCLPHSEKKPLKHQRNGGQDENQSHTFANEPSVDKVLRVEQSIQSQSDFVLLNALTKKEENGIPVYDLTVEDEHEFYANGLLVHNTEDGGDWTVGLLLARTRKKPYTYIILDVIRKQVGYYGRQELMLETAENDVATWCADNDNEYTVAIEKEANSSGKDLTTLEKDNLVGYTVEIDLVRKKKSIRAKPVKSASENKRLKLAIGGWNTIFLERLQKFDPNKASQKDDEVDALSGAFNIATFRVGKTRRGSSSGTR